MQKKMSPYDKFCEDCRFNPEAKKPYAKMMHIRFTDLTKKLLEKAAKEENTTPQCFACKAVLGLMKEKGVLHD